MSEINPSDRRIIAAPDDVAALYTGAGKQESKTGVEVELTFFDAASPDLATMTVAQNHEVARAANAACGGDFVRNEPTAEMLEVGSEAGEQDCLRTVMDNLDCRLSCLTEAAAELGLKRSWFQHLPEKTAEDLLKNLMDTPRYQAFFGPPRADMVKVAAYFSVCKSTQVSVSYTDPAHLLSNLRRLYVLAPFLFMISENTAPFNEGAPFRGHAGMHHRAALGSRGGIPPYVFTAQSGEDYIRAHIDAVMNNPLFVHYDENGNLLRLPSGTWTSFNALKTKGLNTATNYFFAQSVLWPDVKIAALKDEAGLVNGHRYEARMFGVGLHQHRTMLLITAALAYDPVFANSIDQLLKHHGFNQRMPESLKTPLLKAYDTARNHNGAFLDIPYGAGQMSEFAAKFADLLERSPQIASFEKEIEPILTICRTGMTDSKINARLFPTLQSALDFQRHYDPEIFKRRDQCAYSALERELAA
ncbi:MAG: hypothetical protein IT559_05980 [Alphaproteobacteria bacterium]|nr:hypothetical protein [Alphaproteobacteria bacterium]